MCIAANIGGNDDPARGLNDLQTLVIDFEQREFLLIAEHVDNLSFAPHRSPQ